MITVAILINGQPIYTRSAVRVGMKNGMGYYKSDDGKVIQHRYNTGAIPLAQKLLKTIKEPKHEKQPLTANRRYAPDPSCNSTTTSTKTT